MPKFIDNVVDSIVGASFVVALCICVGLGVLFGLIMLATWIASMGTVGAVIVSVVGGFLGIWGLAAFIMFCVEA